LPAWFLKEVGIEREGREASLAEASEAREREACPPQGLPAEAGTETEKKVNGGTATAMRFAPIMVDLPDWLEPVLPAPDAVFAADEERMRLAVALARNNVEQRSGGPFGAAIFDSRTGRFISPGINFVIAGNNSMLHAEAVAIMLAQRALGTYDLSSADGFFELYSSVEPCAMCLGAVHWSGVRRLVCGGRDEDARRIGFDEGHKPAGGVGVLERSGIGVRRDVLREEAVAVLRRYVALGGPIY